MKRLAILLFLLALLPAATYAQSYSAVLNGTSEIPGPGDTDGIGFAVVTIDGTTLHYTVFHQNIGAPTQAHVHTGASDVAGPVLVTLDVNTLTNGSVAVSQEIANQINANPSGFYVNVHNAEFPGGAIRGQLARAEGSGERTALFPIVGKVTGQAGTNFVTDARIVNNGSSTANVTLDYFASNPAGQSGPTTTKNVTVAPGEQKVLDDVVGATLELPSGSFGGLRVTSDQNVLVTARVINDLRAQGEGTAGFAVRGVDEGQTSSTMTFLTQNTDYRTNIGYFNPSASPVSATFVAHASSGAVLGSRTITINPFSMVQQPAFALINTVASGDQTQDNFYVSWTASAPIVVYASVTDNKTGDAVLNQ
jgi:hypothetical protein